jgi:uncharacterized protein (TIGR00251 family)
MSITKTATGVRIDIRVAPRSSRDAVLGEHAGALKVALTAPPVDGEANAALIAFLAKKLGVAARQIRIVHGERGKTKLLEVEGIDEVTAKARLA